MINVKEILKYINSRNGESSISEINKLINEQDRESILKVQTDRMRYEIWDKKSPINGITAKEIIKSRNYKIDKAYLIYLEVKESWKNSTILKKKVNNYEFRRIN